MFARETLTRQTFDALIEKIIDEKLEPGDALPATATLAEQFDISRPVVREALSALQACGFVKLRSGYTPVVAELDDRLIRMFISRVSHVQKNSMSRLMEVRMPLEIEAARLAALRADAVERQKILTANDRMQAALRDSSAYPSLDTSFHAEVAEATDNQILLWTIRSIRSELMATMLAVRQYRDENGLVGNEQAQHDEICAAIADGDADAAAAAMKNHLESSSALIKKVEGNNNDH
ncbi:FadR/GntR family transcriptional regulator [Spelaeicoccus albus]|uniref:DNA-binding FadR family transcriptional regulator n=1 Tax=Spelaeicoccus albus TaxID=1280376 RepID=A0A7Z0D4J5_9MICO|nr:FCD domain-containing protein [Spelaeicoccus albus]NYI68759.1 DNA-binding FadR family transcriptional regulator [Spelaeicoccus albus]